MNHDSADKLYGWRVVAESVKGPDHESLGLPCQYSCKFLFDHYAGRLIGAVADGAGSARCAREGSEIAVTIAVEQLASGVISGEVLPDNVVAYLPELYAEVYRCLCQEANIHGTAIEDYHTTLACVIADREWVVVANLGDGAVVTGDGAGSFRAAAMPSRGEYADSTYFVTMWPQVQDTLKIKVETASIDSIALTTDGLVEVAFEDVYGKCAPWIPFWAPIFEKMRESSTESRLSNKLKSFLESNKVRDICNDDVTLLLAVRDTSTDLGSRSLSSDPNRFPDGPDDRPGY